MTEQNTDARYEWQHLPDAIYFDTDALVSAGFALDQPWLTELRSVANKYGISLFVAAVTIEEWRYRFANHLDKLVNQIRSSVRSMTKYGFDSFGIDPQQLPLPEKAAVNEYVVRLFNNADIATIPTPELELSSLIFESIHSMTPFEEGDKGFRDTIILESILQHAKAEQSDRIMIVSRDKAILNSRDRFSNDSPSAIFVRPDEAQDCLRERANQENTAYIEHRDNRLHEFVQANREPVLQFLRLSQFDVTDWWLRGSLGDKDYAGNIKEIRRIEPKEITGASTILPPLHLELPDTRLPISIFVKIEVEVTTELADRYGGVFGSLMKKNIVAPRKCLT